MIDTTILDGMIAAPAQCEIGLPGCEGAAVEYGVHPTGVALGEEEDWGSVWYCGSCAWEASRDA